MNLKSDWDRGYNAGYDRGYIEGKKAAGFNDGQTYNLIFDRGFNDGWSYQDFEKEECRQIDQCPIPTVQLASHVRSALENHNPLAVIVLGDGEALSLAQERALSIEEVRRRGFFLSYAGVEIPDLEFRDRLADAIRKADYIGTTDAKGSANFQPLLLRTLRNHGIDFRSLKLCSAFFNYEMLKSGILPKILAETKPKVLLIGNEALRLRKALEPNGLDLTEPVAPVKGARDIDRVIAETARRHFDVALVSAGVATAVICVEIARQLGKVALKFGHLADELIQGKAKWAVN